MQAFLYLSVKNKDLNELNAINRLCEHLALNDRDLKLKATGFEFNHSYALYSCECGNYAELKEELKEANCQKLFDFDALMVKSIPSLKTPGVLVMDMDMTSVQIEGIDEIARCLNVYDEVAAITGEAMHGRLDFASSLKKRVSLLKGGDAVVLEKVKSIMHETDGYGVLVKGLKEKGWKVGIASGGFVQLINVLKDKYDLDLVRANSLEIKDGKFTGQVEGEIVDAKKKQAALSELVAKTGVLKDQSIAIGDGANDLLMINTASLGIAYHAKPKVQAEALTCLNYSDLSTILLMLKSGDL